MLGFSGKSAGNGILVFCLFLMLIMLATTCSKPGQSQSGTPSGETGISAIAPKPEDLKGEISWLMRSNPFENDWEQNTVIPKFEKLYPNTKVNIIIVPFDQVDPKLLSMLAARTPPDIFSMWGTSGFMDYYNNDLLLELTPYIDRDIDKNDFVDGIFDIYEVDGKYYHIPQVANFSNMFVYNKTLFREAGLPDLPAKWNDPDWTWDKMVEYAKKLTKGSGSGADAQYGVLLGSAAPHHVLYQFGLDPFPQEMYDTGIADKSNFDDPQIIEILQKWSDLIYVDKVHPNPADQAALEQLGSMFKTGKVAMATSLPTQAYGNFKDCPFEWGLAPWPAGAPGKARGILYNGAWFIAKDSKNAEAAWALLKYLSTPEAAKEMMEITGFLVPLKTVANEWFTLMSNTCDMTVEELEESVTRYPASSGENINHIFCGYAEIETTFRQGLDPLWIGASNAKDTVSGFIGRINEVCARIKADVLANKK
jgi:multiple sugar transport system substrate-binding protein